MKNGISLLRCRKRSLIVDLILLGLLHLGSFVPILSAEEPHDLSRLRGVYPQNSPVILKTSANSFTAFRNGSKVLCTDEKNVELWDMATGNKVLSLEHPDVVIGMALSPDDKRLLTITAGREGPIRLWSLDTAKVTWECPSALGKTKKDRDVEHRDKNGTGSELQWNTWKFFHRDYETKDGFGFTAVAFAQKGLAFAAGDEKGRICLWNAKLLQEPLSMTGKPDRLLDIKFSSDGTRMLALGASGDVSLWNTKTRNLVKRFSADGRSHFARPCDGLIFSPDGRWLTFAGAKGQVFCDAQSGVETHHWPKTGNACRCIAVLPNDELLCQSGHILEIRELVSGKVTRQHIRKSGVQAGYAFPNVVYVEYLPDIAAVITAELECDENTLHENWTTISIVPLSTFTIVP
jgi:hypothetical protein